MNNDSSLLRIRPTAPRRATVIFLHGLGQLTEQWEPMLRRLAPRFPSIEWIAPQAPFMSVTYYGGAMRASWFDVATLPPSSNAFDSAGTWASISTIENLIQRLIQSGMDSRSIILVGFSQGATLALMVALTTLHDLGGVASFSGWLPRPIRQNIIDTGTTLPLFWGHGTSDPEVPVNMAVEAIRFLESVGITGYNLLFMRYLGLAHTVNNPELEDFSNWLANRLYTIQNMDNTL